MAEYDSWEIRMAWQAYRQIRGCPPDAIVLSESANENLTAHLEVCTFCQELRQLGEEAEDEFQLAQRLAETAKPLETEEPIGEGQVRSLLPSLAGWGPKKLFYNPPLVVVLKRARRLGDAVTVAQVHDDPMLFGPGDVFIGEGLFAESWNAYALRAAYLDRLIARVPENKVGRIQELGTLDMPDIEYNTVLKAFRRLEIEVGAFFSIRAVSELMARIQPNLASDLSAAFPSEAAMIEEIRRRKPTLMWPDKESPGIDLLALARFPDCELPLAASGEQKTISVNILTMMSEPGMVDLSPSAAVISVWREQRGGFLVGGKIISRLRAEAELFASFELSVGSLMEAGEAFIVPDTGYFQAFFPHLGETLAGGGKPVFLVLTR